jgi:cell division protein FtsB
MKRLIEQKYNVRQNVIAIFGICLSVYFCYHLIAGERSYLRLISLNHQIGPSEQALADVSTERQDLEQKVVMMRPGSVNRDLLEEQSRKILGFHYPDEKTLIKSAN